MPVGMITVLSFSSIFAKTSEGSKVLKMLESQNQRDLDLESRREGRKVSVQPLLDHDLNSVLLDRVTKNWGLFVTVVEPTLF